MSNSSTPKDPRQVAVGRMNQAKRGPWTEEQREKVRQAIQRTRPWEKSAGPRTPTGKLRSAANGPNHRGKRGQNPDVLAAMTNVSALSATMAELRRLMDA